jgi:hypothetical protein
MTEATLTSVFSEALRAARKEPAPEVEARFYPYAGLSSTIRLRQGRVYVRVSDVLAGSPPEVLYALACMLVAKLYRRKVSGEHERIYKQYTSRREVLDASESVRRQRGYKVITSPRGKVYDLEQAFDDLNARYFQASLVRPLLSWSPGRPRRILGHHDHVHATIIISRALDSAAIPRLSWNTCCIMRCCTLSTNRSCRVDAPSTIAGSSERMSAGLSDSMRRLSGWNRLRLEFAAAGGPPDADFIEMEQTDHVERLHLTSGRLG